MIRMTSIMTVVLSLACSSVGFAAIELAPKAPEKADRSSSGTRRASCLLKITWQPDRFPLDLSSIDSLMESSSVKGRAVREVLGLPYDEVLEDRVIIEMDLIGDGGGEFEERVLLIRLEVSIPKQGGQPEIPAVAEEFQAALCARFQETIEVIGEDLAGQLEDRIARVRGELEMARANLSRIYQVQQALCAEAHQVDLERDYIMDLLRQFEGQRRELEMERMAQRARREAIERQLARITEQVKENTGNDPIVRELQRVVELQVRRHRKIQQAFEEKMASESEVMESEEQLARAKAELALQRRESVRSNNGEMMQQLNHELITLSISADEQEARFMFVSEQLEKSRPLLELANRYEQEVSLRLPMAREAVEQSMER
ncbi:MAG: hypothetical protein ACE5EC_03810, partial [Phycisphaerae bacterium]